MQSKLKFFPKNTDIEKTLPKKNLFYFVHVLPDGYGDFPNFKAIHKYFQNEFNPETLNFIAVIKHYPLHKKMIEESIASLNLHSVFLLEGKMSYSSEDILFKEQEKFPRFEDLDRQPEVQQLLRDAKLIIQIPTWFPGLSNYLMHTNNECMLLKIDEHELKHSINLSQNFPVDRIVELGMGLGKDRFGIKLNHCGVNSDKSSLNLIEDEKFKKRLLGSKTQEEYSADHFLITAYSNQLGTIINALILLLNNTSLQSYNNMDIYCSSSKSKEFNHYLQFFLLSLPTSGWINCEIKEIKIISPGNSCKLSLDSSNGDSGKTSDKGWSIRIFTNIWLNDKDYNTLLQNSNLAIVTGDNTFEETINKNILPLYVSTHALSDTSKKKEKASKRDTAEGMAKICESIEFHNEKLNPCFAFYFRITALINLFGIMVMYPSNGAINVVTNQQELLDVFENPEIKKLMTSKPRFGDELRAEENTTAFRKVLAEFRNLDIKKMMAQWPKVCDELKAKYNFYDSLDKELPKISRFFDEKDLIQSIPEENQRPK